jgi:hypothetical protein
MGSICRPDRSTAFMLCFLALGVRGNLILRIPGMDYGAGQRSLLFFRLPWRERGPFGIRKLNTP